MKLSQLLTHSHQDNHSLQLGELDIVKSSQFEDGDEYVADYVFFPCPACGDVQVQTAFWIEDSVTDCANKLIPPNTLIVCKDCANDDSKYNLHSPEDFAKLNGLPLWIEDGGRP